MDGVNDDGSWGGEAGGDLDKIKIEEEKEE